MITLRPYQSQIDERIRAAWNDGARNVLAALPCRAGKTINMAKLFHDHAGAAIGIAHRQELVTQMSLATARFGIRHRIIGSPALVRNAITIHMQEFGRSFYDPNARIGIGGVDTIIRREATDPWFQQVTLWQTDECHHVLRENKWGEACAMFPNARGVGWTATPGRADGYGLGRHADGVMDVMIMGPSMRALIGERYLADYRIFCPLGDMDLTDVTVTAGGDYSPPKLRAAAHKSHIVGDVVKHYCRIAPGKLGVTFAVDIEQATEMAQAYRAAGVAAEVVTSKTPDTLRMSILRRYRNREIMQLVNVDLFGEGMDVGPCEVVSMARPTASYPLYHQQFNRCLTPSEGKAHGIVIDHVSNVIRHGLPDALRYWSLGRRERRGARKVDDAIPVRACPQCTGAYERVRASCPYCGFRPEPAGRSRPDQVDGDLTELTPAALAALRGEIDHVDGDAHPPGGVDWRVASAIQARHMERREAQKALREAVALWAGWHRGLGRDDSEIYRRFYFSFGVDVMTAQALGRPEAESLTTRVAAQLIDAGVSVSSTPG